MSGRTLWALPFALLVAGLIMTVGPYAELSELAASSGGVLDEVPRGSAEAVSAHLGAIGEGGRELYRRHFWWDLPFLALNASILWLLLRFGLSRVGAKRATKVRSWLLCLPLLVGACDLVENLAVRELVANWQQPSALAVKVGLTATWSKLILGSLTALGAMLLLLGLVTRWLWSRSLGKAGCPAA